MLLGERLFVRGRCCCGEAEEGGLGVSFVLQVQVGAGANRGSVRRDKSHRLADALMKEGQEVHLSNLFRLALGGPLSSALCEWKVVPSLRFDLISVPRGGRSACVPSELPITVFCPADLSGSADCFLRLHSARRLVDFCCFPFCACLLLCCVLGCDRTVGGPAFEPRCCRRPLCRTTARREQCFRGFKLAGYWCSVAMVMRVAWRWRDGNGRLRPNASRNLGWPAARWSLDLA